jgi:cell wall-associated NlpC family hydrolase
MMHKFIKMKKYDLRLVAISACTAFAMMTSCNVSRLSNTDADATPTEMTTMVDENNRSIDENELQLRQNIIGYAQNFLGLHYRSGGRTPRTGFDCSGFVGYILNEYKVKVSGGASTLATKGRKISLADARPGDLVFFGRKKRISHVAFVLESTPEGVVCVHSTSSRGIIIENVSQSDYWKNKILFAKDLVHRKRVS